MIILKTTALTALLAGSSSAPLPIVCSYVELSDQTYTPTPVVTATNGVTPVEIVGAAATNYARQVKLLTVTNVNVLAATVTLKHGTTILIKVALPGNHTLVYTDGRGFSVLDSTGATITGTSAGGVSVHTLLDGTVHTDTVAQTPTRGSLVKGNSTPAWDELVIGAAARVLRSDGSDASWAQVALATDVSGTLPVANGGTGATTFTSGGVLQGAGTGAITASLVPAVNGIKFPATQVDSGDVNTLDDYEEGTFTPVLGGATSESGQTYSTQQGNYVKIGSLVHVGIYMQFSNKGTITGNLVVKGLPFAGGGGSFTHAATIGYMTNMAAGTKNPKNGILGYVAAADSRILMYAVNDFVSVNPTPMDGTDVNNTTQLVISATYRTNY